MSGLNEQNARVQLKYTTLSGDTPTIAPSTDHTDGNWNATDIYVGELMINAATDSMWFRSLNGIIPITSGTTYIDNTAYVNKSGGTMTGGLITPSLSATSISAITITSNGFNGIFVGDGSGLTGITSTTFTGGTISGPTTFTSTVDLCGAGVTVDTLSGCGGTLSILSDLEASGAISATTFYGSAAGLTDMPSLSGITLDEVLTQGDTSTDGNIQLTNGSITLDNGVFYGDGSGLTNIPSSPIPTLDDVLTTGNVSEDNDLLLTNGDIILGNGIFYGDGSGLTNLVATNDIFVTGGTYNNTSGTATFTNNTGDTFTVTGFTTGSTQTLEDTLILGNSTGNNWIEVDITSSENGIRSNDSKDRVIEFNPDGIDLYVSGSVLDTKTSIGMTDSQLRILAFSGTSGFPDTEAYIDIYPNGNIQLESTGSFDINSEILTINGQIGSFSGAQYTDDFSAQFTDRSLVDKEYIDSSISGFSTGYTYIDESTYAERLTFTAPGAIRSYSNEVTSRVSGDTMSGYYDHFITTDTSKNRIFASTMSYGDYTLSMSDFDNDGVSNYLLFSEDGTGYNYMAAEHTLATEKSINIFSTADDTETLFTQQASYIQTRATDGTDTSLITVQPNNIWIEGTGTFQGAKYDGDYSANFVNRSLVDKEYVDNAISGFTTGNTLEQVLILGNISGENDILITKGHGVYAEDNQTTGLDLDGGYAKLVVTNGFTEEGYIDIQVNGNTSMFGTAALEIDFNNISINSSNSGFTGIEYFVDYSADYTNRSLVDKEYVDNAISGFSTFTGYTYITEDTVAQTLVFSGANSVVTNIVNGAKTQTLTTDLDEIRLRADDTDISYTSILHLDRNNVESNVSKLEDGIYYYSNETLTASQKNINIGNDTDSAQATYTLTQISELTRIENGIDKTSECNINADQIYLLNSSGEGRNTWLNVEPSYAEMKQDEGSSVTRLQVSNADGFYQSQIESTGYGKGVSKTKFVVNQTTDDTPLSLVWPLSGLEVGTTAVGIKATVTGMNSTDDKAYISELYAAVRMNAYAVTIFGGVDKLEKTEYTTATSTIDIESSNVAIIVTGEVGETIRWSVKYELIYAIA